MTDPLEPALDDAAMDAAGTGRDVPPPPRTDDPEVDAALARLHGAASGGTLDDQADAGEATHRTLQDRLTDLGGG